MLKRNLPLRSRRPAERCLKRLPILPTPDPEHPIKALPFLRFGWGGFSVISPGELVISPKSVLTRPPCGFQRLAGFVAVEVI